MREGVVAWTLRHKVPEQEGTSMWLHDRREGVDVGHEQLHLRHERRVVAVGLHEVAQPELRTLDAVAHAHVLHHQGVRSESHVLVLARDADQRIRVLERLGRKCDGRADRVAHALDVARAPLAVPRAKEGSQ